ncbi:hypothetical protein MMPV_006727 [Pyropia vietnamensis]
MSRCGASGSVAAPTEPYAVQTVAWLRAAARKRGLDSTGTKAALVDRLRSADVAAATAAAAVDTTVAPYATAYALEEEEEEEEKVEDGTDGGGGAAAATTTDRSLRSRTPSAAAESYSARKVVALRAELKGQGLSISGLKADLVSRLVAADFSWPPHCPPAGGGGGRRAWQE